MRVYFATGSHTHKKANASVLIGAWQVIFLGRSASEAYAPLVALEPFVPFRDASSGSSTHNMTVLDCLAVSS